MGLIGYPKDLFCWAENLSYFRKNEKHCQESAGYRRVLRKYYFDSLGSAYWLCWLAINR